jgi:hypothetical protein
VNHQRFDVDQAVELLERTPGVLRSLLTGLSDAWVHATEGPETWSPYDVLGHLIHGEETDWIGRARMILEHGEQRTFEPFDRTAFFRKSDGKTLPGLLDEFEALRHQNIEALRAFRLTPEHLQRRGRHPDFGPVTLAQLLATWTVHDLTHLTQIVRVLARQYDAEVGPWKAYLGVLRR